MACARLSVSLFAPASELRDIFLTFAVAGLCELYEWHQQAQSLLMRQSGMPSRRHGGLQPRYPEGFAPALFSRHTSQRNQLSRQLMELLMHSQHSTSQSGARPEDGKHL